MNDETSQRNIPPHFEKLRDMETFTEAMFNRIVAFQERLHPAWDAGKPFDERIRDLPLHALIFSNPDRDPATHAHTVAPFYPLREEMRQIAHCARQVAEQPVVCDFHSRNGFLGSLLGREGVSVIGIHDPADKPNQIPDFYDEAVFTRSAADYQSVDFAFDVAFSAWMPAGHNRTPEIVQYRPKLIVFIHTDHIDESSGRPQTGTMAAFRELPPHYRLVAAWSITRPRDLLHEIWPDLTPSIEETRHVKIYADEPWHGIDVGAELPPATPYDWENELDMALTALEAKAHLRDKGFPV
ncbi:MAG TPA: hypothetical protein ENK48_02565 [Gammaproteobacteria bacterium]|nr:hypothetical protein [Gammaproteobacteria bacterium]